MKSVPNVMHENMQTLKNAIPSPKAPPRKIAASAKPYERKFPHP
jgi:hypothetical protein